METISELIDKLNIVNIKLYHLFDSIEDNTKTDTEVASAARKVQILNRDRSKLKNEIDSYFGEYHQEVKM